MEDEIKEEIEEQISTCSTRSNIQEVAEYIAETLRGEGFNASATEFGEVMVCEVIYDLIPQEYGWEVKCRTLWN